MTKTISIPNKVDFRLRQHEAEWASRLAEQAAKAGRSFNDHARELLKTALVADEQTLLDIQLLRQDIANLGNLLKRLPAIEAGAKATHDNLYQLRDDLLFIAIKLLIDAGHLDQQDAETWARETFHVES